MDYKHGRQFGLHVGLDYPQALFGHERELGRADRLLEGEMAFHHLLHVLAEGGGGAKRQMHDAANALGMRLVDGHVPKGLAAFLDEPEVFVEPDHDLDLVRQLLGEFVEIVQRLLQGGAADDDGVHDDGLAAAADLLVNVVLDEVMRDGDEARRAGVDDAMRVLGQDRLQHDVEMAGVQDGALHERDARHFQRGEA